VLVESESTKHRVIKSRGGRVPKTELEQGGVPVSRLKGIPGTVIIRDGGRLGTTSREGLAHEKSGPSGWNRAPWGQKEKTPQTSQGKLEATQPQTAKIQQNRQGEKRWKKDPYTCTAAYGWNERYVRKRKSCLQSAANPERVGTIRSDGEDGGEADEQTKGGKGKSYSEGEKGKGRTV